MHTPDHAQPPARKPFYARLTVQVVAAIAAGVMIGVINPKFGASLEPVVTVFTNLVKMVVGPIIFLTIVVGISTMGDLKKVGRVGIKALIYFELITTLALTLGLVVANVVRPGEQAPEPATMTATAATAAATASTAPATQAVDQYSFGKFFMGIIPDNALGALAKGDVLQILFFAILFGIAVSLLGERGRKIAAGCELLAEVMFKIMAIIMKFAPIWAMAAMAFVVGKYGIATLKPLALLMGCVYLTMILFIGLVLGGVCLLAKVSLLKYLAFIKDEIMLVVGTSSSESALPRMMLKMEAFGCSGRVVRMVIPAGYSFNLDGTSIYLSMATLFIAQATKTPLTLSQQLAVLGVLMLTSKGAAGVSGSGFITLRATLDTTGLIPGFEVSRVVGVDKFMSEARAITNLIGNGVAAIVVSKLEKEFDQKKYQEATTRKRPVEMVELL